MSEKTTEEKINQQIDEYVLCLRNEQNEPNDGIQTESQIYANKLANILRFIKQEKLYNLYKGVRGVLISHGKFSKSKTQTYTRQADGLSYKVYHDIMKLDLPEQIKQKIDNLEKQIIYQNFDENNNEFVAN